MKDLKELREKNGFTQEQIAAYLGLDQSLIAKYESGDRHIKLIHINKLSALYGCDILDDNSKEIKMNNAISKSLSTEDLVSLSEINKISLNLKMMDKNNLWYFHI